MKTVNFCFKSPDAQLPKATLPLVEGSLKHGEVVGRYKGYTFVLYKVNPALPSDSQNDPDGNIAMQYILSYIRSNKIIPLFRELVNGKACYAIGKVFSGSMEQFIQMALSYAFPENQNNSNVVAAELLKVSPKKVIGKIDGKKLVVGGKLSDTKKDELRLMRLNATSTNDEDEEESYVFTDLIGIEELSKADITTIDEQKAKELAAKKENTLINNIEAVSVYYTSNPL